MAEEGKGLDVLGWGFKIANAQTRVVWGNRRYISDGFEEDERGVIFYELENGSEFKLWKNSFDHDVFLGVVASFLVCTNSPSGVFRLAFSERLSNLIEMHGR